MLTFSLCCTAFASKTALKNFEKGLRAMENGNYEGAITLFEKAISFESKDKKMRIGMMYYNYAPNKKIRECKVALDKRVKKPVIEKEVDRHKPEIVLFEPLTRKGLNPRVKGKAITLKGTVKDTSRISWAKINQIDISLDKNGHFQKSIPLSVGINNIIIEASDIFGNQSRFSLIVERKKVDIKIADIYERSFAVIIGIDDYDSRPKLEYAVNAAMAVSQKLKKIGFDQVITIIDKEAVKERITNEIYNKLLMKAKPEDRVLIYFAGHVHTEVSSDESKNGYFIPSGAPSTDYKRTAIAIEQIKDFTYKNIQARHILFVMDACFSGFGLKRSYDDSLLAGDLKELATLKSVQIITAGGSGEHVKVINGKSLFTTFFLKALDGDADMDKDGIITGSELGAYLQPSVSSASYRKQTPLWGRLAGKGEFFLLDNYY